jgi:protein-disulfide isomerase
MINPQVRLRVPVSKHDHQEGPKDAPLVLLEYGDYECPHCGQAYWTVKHLQETLNQDLHFVFRNFPLTQIHPNAMNAARAAEAAGLQGKFRPMHDIIFEHQDSLDVLSLLSYAETLDLDMDQFNQDMVSAEVEQKVLQDMENGTRSGVNGTPTFFVNNFRWEGELSYDALLRAMQSARRAIP